MAQLTDEQKIEVGAELMREWSAVNEVIPLSKAQLWTMLNVFDAALENTDTVILNNVATAARTWLLAHVDLARYVLAEVAEKRAEVL